MIEDSCVFSFLFIMERTFVRIHILSQYILKGKRNRIKNPFAEASAKGTKK
ncbi:hypothetical protein PMEGAPR185_16310 [Priestia megaterium]